MLGVGQIRFLGGSIGVGILVMLGVGHIHFLEEA